MIFRLTYCNRFKDTARIEIKTPGSSTIKEVEGTENPFTLQYKNDKSDKSGNFRTSSAEINIYETSDFNIDTLKTSSETDIKVDYYINDVKKWTGYVIPDFFSREIGGSGVVSMVASDRISTLRGVTLGELPEYISIRELAVRCLANTGLDLPLKTMADFSAGSNANDFYNSEILSQRLIDTKGRSISCHDILNSILIASNSLIIQRNAEWYIVSKFQHENGTGKLYNSASSSTNWTESVHNFNEITKGAMRSIIPVAASVGIFHEHGGGRLHPENYDFSKDLNGWNSVGGFSASVDSREVNGFTVGGSGGAVYTPVYGKATEKKYLINNNQYVRNENPRYLESSPIDIPYSGLGSINVEIDLNGVGPKVYPNSPSAAILRVAIVAVSGSQTLTLDHGGKFVPMPSINPPVFEKEFVRGFVQPDFSAGMDTKAMKVNGILEVGNLQDYKIKVRIYGSGSGVTVLLNSVSVKMKNSQEMPKGNLYKREQGSNFTKTHNIDTTIFGDFITGGLNGYFYDYPIDDTSSLFSPNGDLRSMWTSPGDDEERPLLLHSVRQKARMFSVAHDLISGEIDMVHFDPLAIFQDCKGKKYTVVSADVDFLNSVVRVDIEEIAFQSLPVRDFIYSYFGEGESGISSVGGIASGTGGGAGGGGMTSEQLAILNEVEKKAHEHNNKAILDKLTQEMLDNASREMVTSDSKTPLSDNNYLSSARTLKEIAERALSKLNPDTANEVITFLKGWSTNTFSQGTSGSALYPDADGNWHIQAEYVHVLRKLTAEEIEIQKTSHIGGKLMQTAASMSCIGVEDHDSFYRCFMRTEDNEGRKIYNQFKINDQALVETFNLIKQADGNTGNHFLWRLVVGVGENYIDLSKNICAVDSDIPLVDDNIVQLGYQGTDDPDRQNAIIMAGAGEGSPYFKQYVGIKTFSLPPEETRLKPGDNLFTGKLNIQPGSTGAANLGDLPNEVVKAVQVGSINLLRNSGFTGDYETINVETLDINGNVFSDPLKFWTGSATIQEDSEAVSGFSAVIGSLEQEVKLIHNENYVVSLKAKGANVSIACGGFSANQVLSDGYEKHVFRFKNSYGTTFKISGNATICDLQLERGTVETDYSRSILDNDKSMAEFLSLQYLTSSINNASTTTLGGLILSNIIMAGNYVDKKMSKVTAGISGIYNNDDDVAIWSGGELLKAIKAVQAFKDNPAKELTSEEWEELANCTITHGGRAIMNDIILRGYIYALGGIFRGKVESNADGNRIVIDPEDRSMKMITETGKVVIKISFRGERQADIRFYMYNDDGSIDRTTSFGTDEGYYVQRYGVNGNPLSLIRYGNDGQIANSYLPNLTDAQADAILVTGMWYRTGRVIKVKD